MVAPCSQVPRLETMKVTRSATSSTVPKRMVLLNSRESRRECPVPTFRCFPTRLDPPPRPVGLDHARMNAIDLNAFGFAAVGKAFGEAGHRRIDRTADGEFRGGLARAGAADRNQRTVSRLQKRPGGAGQTHMGEEFQRIAVFPVGVGKLEEVAALGGAGIVDQNVEPAELALGLLDELFRRGLLS